MLDAMVCINPSNPEEIFGEQASKFGAWGSNSLVGNFFYMEAGQQLFPHKLESTDQIYVVLDGEAEFQAYDDDEIAHDLLYRPEAGRRVDPAPKAETLRAERTIRAQSGAVIAVSSNTFHAIANCGQNKLTVLAVGTPVISRALYTSR